MQFAFPFAVFALPSDNYKYSADDKAIISNSQGTFSVGNNGRPLDAAYNNATFGGYFSTRTDGKTLVFLGPLNGASCAAYRADCYKQYDVILVSTDDPDSGSHINVRFFRNLPNPSGTQSPSVQDSVSVLIAESDGTSTPPPAIVPCDPDKYNVDITGIVYKDKKESSNIIKNRTKIVNLSPDMGIETTELPTSTDGSGRYTITDVLNAITNSECNGDSYKVFVKYRVDSTFLDILKADSLIDAAVKQDEEVWLVGETTVTIDKDGNVSNGDIIVKEVRISALDKAISSAIKFILQGVSAGLKWTVGNINGLLTQTEDIIIGAPGEESDLNGPWVSIKNVAVSLLVMALVIIAFANVMQVDLEQYGLARMIPKIIISIIMAFGSWIIVVFFFDLAAAIQAQAKFLAGGVDILGTLQSIDVGVPNTSQIVANLGILIVVIVILIGVWACGIVLLFTLLLRIVMLAFLLVVAPLAFILNIMPFTSSMYKQWWSEFFKWMFMGPIAFAIIALGGVIVNAVGFGAGSQNLTDPAALDSALNISNMGTRGNMLLGLVIFAASLYMAATLPMQWGGKLMSAWTNAGKKAWGATGGNALKGAGWAATHVGGKRSISRMIGKGKGWLDTRKANQATADKAELTGWQASAASKGGLSRWAATGVTGNRAASVAAQLHQAEVAAAHEELGMSESQASKEDLMKYTGAGYSRNAREAATVELARRGLLDMSNSELEQFDGAKGMDKQSLFNEFVGGNADLRNVAMKNHKDLIINAGDATSDDFKNKAMNKILDSSLTSINSGELKAAMEYAGRTSDLADGKRNITQLHAGIKGANDEETAKLKAAASLNSDYGKSIVERLTNQGLSQKDAEKKAVEEVKTTISAQKVVENITRAHVQGASKFKGAKRMDELVNGVNGDYGKVVGELMHNDVKDEINRIRSGNTQPGPTGDGEDESGNA